MSDAPTSSPVDLDAGQPGGSVTPDTVPADGAPTDASAAQPGAPALTVGAPPGRRVRARLARLGAQRPSSNPVLEPLFRIVRQTHPKADLRMLERAYEVAERPPPRARSARAATRTSPTRWPWPRSSPSSGMTPPTLCAALLHDTVEDTAYTLDALRARLRRRDRAPGRRRDQARQGHVRRGGAGRDRPQDGRRDGPRHPGARHQARRPAAQHAHLALRQPAISGAEGARDARDLRAAGPPARHEHHQVGARGPRVRDALPEGLRRDRPAGRRARAQPRRLPRRRHRAGQRRPARARRSRRRSPAGPSTTTPSTRR